MLVAILSTKKLHFFRAGLNNDLQNKTLRDGIDSLGNKGQSSEQKKEKERV